MKGVQDVGEPNNSKLSYIREVTQNPGHQLQLLREWRQKNLTKIIQLPV